MTDMIARAAVAIFDVRERCYPMDSNEEAARAAILSALDLNDMEMTTLAHAAFHADVTKARSNIQATALQVRAAIEAIKAMAQGERQP